MCGTPILSMWTMVGKPIECHFESITKTPLDHFAGIGCMVHLELSAQAHTRTCRRQLGRVFTGIYGCVCYEALGNLFLIYEIKDTIVSYWVILLLTAVQNICLHR